MDKRKSKAKAEQKALPPPQYDGQEQESGVILTPAEALDIAAGADSL